ncbi:hypothetical protein [Ammoniphilus oxalaticus]|nr:hypothetical protein [Ammoniphilus oxalaticus]
MSSLTMNNPNFMACTQLTAGVHVRKWVKAGKSEDFAEAAIKLRMSIKK